MERRYAVCEEAMAHPVFDTPGTMAPSGGAVREAGILYLGIYFS